MNIRAIIWLVAIAVIIGIGVFIYIRKKNSGGGSSGSDDKPGCIKPGNACSSVNDCCDGNDCLDGKCSSRKPIEEIATFYLEASDTEKGTVKPQPGGLLKVSHDHLKWSSKVPDFFWTWDGVSNIMLVSPEVDASGKVTKVTSQSIQPPSSDGAYVSLGQKISTGVTLTKDGSIYTTDYTMCVNVDDTQSLVWQKCLGYPYKFNIDYPTDCKPPGNKCVNDHECCAPYSTCTDGKCAACFGDPHTACPDPTTKAVCKGGTYQCESKCTDTPLKCMDNQESKCAIDGNNFKHVCTWKCTDPQRKDCFDGNSMCSIGADGKYVWTCPVNPCDQPPPDISHAPPYSDTNYKFVDGHYEHKTDPTKPIYIAIWNCHAQKWDYKPGCSSHKKTCDGKRPVCSSDTNFEWVCADEKQYPNMCGLSANTGDCGPDAKCMDISGCGSGTNTASDWRWICPSSENTPICEIMKSNQWQFPGTAIADKTVFFQNANTPIYPTVRNEKCRDTSASYIPGKEIREKIGNPSAIIQGDTKLDIFPIPTKFSGKDANIFTLFNTGNPEVPQWSCSTPNPCGQHGSFSLGTGPYAPFVVPRPSNYIGPPTGDELMTKGKCTCDDHYAGTKCQYTSSDCSGNGVPKSCNTNDPMCNNSEYMCVCNAGFSGNKCQYSDSTTCSNHGTATPDGKCNCDAGLVGGGNCSSGLFKIRMSDFGNNGNCMGFHYQGVNVPAPGNNQVQSVGVLETNTLKTWLYDSKNGTICLADANDTTTRFNNGGGWACLTTAATNSNEPNLSNDGFQCVTDSALSTLHISNYRPSSIPDARFERWAFSADGKLVDTNCPATHYAKGTIIIPDKNGPRRCVQFAPNSQGAFVLAPGSGDTNGQCTTFHLLDDNNHDTAAKIFNSAYNSAVPVTYTR